MQTYGTGLLLLQAPVMRIQRLYRLPDNEYVVLLTLLRQCPCLGHFMRTMSAAYKVTCAAHANSEQQ